MTELDVNQVRANIDRVRGEIDQACRAAGRDQSEVTLIAVTKNFPSVAVEFAVTAGLTDVGESKAQELSAKHDALSQLAVNWHFIGRLQRNKAKSVVAHADVIASIDRLPLLNAVDRAAQDCDRFTPEQRLAVMLQVDLDPAAVHSEGTDGGAARGGVQPAELMALATEVARSGALGLSGLMAIAPLGQDPAPCFERLASLSEMLRTEHPSATAISAGMSTDFVPAIKNGATHVRVGTALFGARPLPSN